MTENQNHAGATKRLEALSDGIFAIAATLLVLEIRIPDLGDGTTPRMMSALEEILPSLVAFVLSFLNILIFWFNHDSVGKVITRYDTKLTYLNLLFLLFISLVPFTTAFISRNPFNIVSVTVYGFLFLLMALSASFAYYYLAFGSGLMHDKVSNKSRRKIWKRFIMGPIFYAVAIALGFINVYIPIVIYLLVPFLFVVFPKIEFEEGGK